MAPKTFARRIELLRQERGWSQNQLAARAGLRAADLSRILTGTRSLLSHHVARLAAALEISVDALIERTGVEVDLREGVSQEALMRSESTRASIEARLASHRALAIEVLSDLEKAHELLGDSAGRESARLAKVLGSLSKVVKAPSEGATSTNLSVMGARKMKRAEG